MLPFGVTIPATVAQGSEIPEGLINYPVLRSSVHLVGFVWKKKKSIRIQFILYTHITTSRHLLYYYYYHYYSHPKWQSLLYACQFNAHHSEISKPQVKLMGQFSPHPAWPRGGRKVFSYRQGKVFSPRGQTGYRARTISSSPVPRALMTQQWGARLRSWPGKST